MTRQEWFDNQTPEVQKQFKFNCNTLNFVPLFEHWVNYKNSYTPGISGAFSFFNTPEGFKYWKDIDCKALEQIDYKDEE